MVIVEYDEKTFPSVLKERRLDLRLTQKQLSQRSGVCLASINNYENGYLRPPTHILVKLMKALQVDEVRIIL